MNSTKYSYEAESRVEKKQGKLGLWLYTNMGWLIGSAVVVLLNYAALTSSVDAVQLKNNEQDEELKELRQKLEKQIVLDTKMEELQKTLDKFSTQLEGYRKELNDFYKIRRQ